MIDDWSINVRVETELVKNWVDTKQIDFTTIGGVVYIKGKLNFQLDVFVNPDEPDYFERREMVEVEKLKRIERNLKKISGVKAVKFELENWFKMGNRWVKQKPQAGKR
jgi:osmotically-inducible protein OsmY